MSAASLACGLIAHYSAGPYIVLLAVAWVALNRTRVKQPGYWQHTALCVLVGGLILATWFGWSFTVYGTQTTLFSNSSVNPKDVAQGSQLVKIALNLRDTAIPHFLRPMDRWLIAQPSPWGYWRDWFFQVYQINLFFMFGSVAWLAVLRELARDWRVSPRPWRWFWTWFVAGAFLLGVAVHGARDNWGLAHICLQSLLVVGLAYLAAHWTRLGRGWRLAVIAGATVDFCLGIALHFGVQSYAFDQWLTPGRPVADTLKSYSQFSQMNIYAKVSHKLAFAGDALSPTSIFVLLAAILAFALMRAARRAD
jgi:hypothetical protein